MLAGALIGCDTEVTCNNINKEVASLESEIAEVNKRVANAKTHFERADYLLEESTHINGLNAIQTAFRSTEHRIVAVWNAYRALKKEKKTQKKARELSSTLKQCAVQYLTPQYRQV